MLKYTDENMWNVSTERKYVPTVHSFNVRNVEEIMPGSTAFKRKKEKH